MFRSSCNHKLAVKRHTLQKCISLVSCNFLEEPLFWVIPLESEEEEMFVHLSALKGKAALLLCLTVDFKSMGYSMTQQRADTCKQEGKNQVLLKKCYCSPDKPSAFLDGTVWPL